MLKAKLKLSRLVSTSTDCLPAYLIFYEKVHIDIFLLGRTYWPHGHTGKAVALAIKSILMGIIGYT